MFAAPIIPGKLYLMRWHGVAWCVCASSSCAAIVTCLENVQ